MIGAVAGQSTAVQGVVGSIPAWTTLGSGCDVYMYLYVVTIPEWGKVKKKILIVSS